MKQAVIFISLCLLALCSPSVAKAQSWVIVSPAGAQFSVQMPAPPITTAKEYNVGQFNVAGQRYSVSDHGVDYHLWSLRNPSFADYKSLEGENYEDGCADLVWDGLFKPWRDKL
ncbi:MAG: hypothetical protein ABJC10_14680, partial [Acidobacteriota bacterium]